MSRGKFVVLIGPDGVGKTTLARELIARHSQATMYVHFRPNPWRRPPATPVDGLAMPKRKEVGSPLVGWLRLARSFIFFWLGYWRWILPALRRGTLVVGDRWIYGYVGQPDALGFAGPSWLARWAVRLAPWPDLVVRLNAPPEVVAGRKADLTPPAIAAENSLWSTLPGRVVELDATIPPDELANGVSELLAMSKP